ncbi:MAG: hypothetical protein ACD_23C00889G0006, partial [uncultured bacterium]
MEDFRTTVNTTDAGLTSGTASGAT